MIIAVDGPAAAGKGTIARAIAKHFGFHFLDTGTLYRRVGLVLTTQTGEATDPASAEAIAKSIDSIPYQEQELRTESVAEAASIVASMPAVRTALRDFQRGFASKLPGAVLDGRDIGTVVCPDADVKLFVTARPEIRAQRRLQELVDAGEKTDYGAVLNEIAARDERDSRRPVSPLLPASDAIVLDTSDLTIEEAVAAAIRHVELGRGRRVPGDQKGPGA
jgi:CMP/dCMP kinase